MSVGASLMAVFFLVLAGSFEGLSPGSLEVFLLIVLFTLAGSVFFLHRLHQGEFDPARVSSTGTVLYERPWGRGRVVLIGTSRGKLVAHLSPSAVFREGDEVDIDGVIEPFGRSPEEGGFDEARFWKARGAVGKIRRPDIRLTRDDPGGILRLRRNLRERILLNLPPLMRGHLLAAILGGRDPDLAEKHSEWGTSHLLAVSGLHAGVVVLVIFLLMLFFFRNIRLV
ncbi:MAG TPA: ComEC/Rec2 family competence protein, partial [Synergistales bacterium]|nr:ComEC/Rec2 family competence protein [Synergistales bacterium]